MSACLGMLVPILTSFIATQRLLVYKHLRDAASQPTPTVTITATSLAPQPAEAFYTSFTSLVSSFDAPDFAHGPAWKVDRALVLVLAVLVFGSFAFSAFLIRMVIKNQHRQQEEQLANESRRRDTRVAQPVRSVLLTRIASTTSVQAFLDYLQQHRNHTFQQLFSTQTTQLAPPPLIISWHNLLAEAYSQTTLTWFGLLPPVLTARFLRLLVFDDALKAEASAPSIQSALSAFGIEVRFIRRLHVQADVSVNNATRVVSNHEGKGNAVLNAPIAPAKVGDASEEQQFPQREDPGLVFFVSQIQRAPIEYLYDHALDSDPDLSDEPSSPDSHSAEPLSLTGSTSRLSNWVHRSYGLAQFHQPRYTSLLAIPGAHDSPEHYDDEVLAPSDDVEWTMTDDNLELRRCTSTPPDCAPFSPAWYEEPDTGPMTPLPTELDVDEPCSPSVFVAAGRSEDNIDHQINSDDGESFFEYRRSKSCPPDNRIRLEVAPCVECSSVDELEDSADSQPWWATGYGQVTDEPVDPLPAAKAFRRQVSALTRARELEILLDDWFTVLDIQDKRDNHAEQLRLELEDELNIATAQITGKPYVRDTGSGISSLQQWLDDNGLIAKEVEEPFPPSRPPSPLPDSKTGMWHFPVNCDEVSSRLLRASLRRASLPHSSSLHESSQVDSAPSYFPSASPSSLAATPCQGPPFFFGGAPCFGEPFRQAAPYNIFRPVRFDPAMNNQLPPRPMSMVHSNCNSWPSMQGSALDDPYNASFEPMRCRPGNPLSGSGPQMMTGQTVPLPSREYLPMSSAMQQQHQ